MKLVGALGLLLVIVSGCNRTYDPTPDYISTIFPLDEGKYRIYTVIDTLWETTSSSDFEVQQYYKQEVNGGIETDLLDRETTTLWINRSPDSLGNAYDWTFDQLWTQYAGDEYSERIEGNIRYLVMRNPAFEDASWNGNLFNDEDQQTYRITSIDTTVEVQGVTYENCVFVRQQEFYQPVSDSLGPIFISEEAYEIYAPGIGKIRKYFKYYTAQSGDPDAESRILREDLVTHNYD